MRERVVGARGWAHAYRASACTGGGSLGQPALRGPTSTPSPVLRPTFRLRTRVKDNTPGLSLGAGSDSQGLFKPRTARIPAVATPGIARGSTITVAPGRTTYWSIKPIIGMNSYTLDIPLRNRCRGSYRYLNHHESESVIEPLRRWRSLPWSRALPRKSNARTCPDVWRWLH